MAWNFARWCILTIFRTRGGGTPYVMGDTYVPRFWPPFFTLAGSSTIFLGYFFSSTNSKAIFWGTKTTNFYKNRSFWPQIQFFPRSFWVQFSAASGTPPSVFRPSTPPGIQNWLVYGLGLLIFLILALFWLSETGQIWGFRAFPRERMEGMAWNFARWCSLTTFRTD